MALAAAVGIASRRDWGSQQGALASFFATYAGDTLWALFAFLA